MVHVRRGPYAFAISDAKITWQEVLFMMKVPHTRVWFSVVTACGLYTVLSCNSAVQSNQVQPVKHSAEKPAGTTTSPHIYNNRNKVIHVFVALCDNLHQGIEPVPKGIGNGQDPATNLYWGCDYGVKAFFKNKTSWQLVSVIKNPAPHVLERCLFKEPAFNAFMVADAFDGACIKNAMQDFVNATAGTVNDTIIFGQDTLGIAGNANIVAYVGHEGLMDFSLDSFPPQRDTRRRDAIILACESRQYWGRILHRSGANPLLWTTELMCPEAYTLHAAVTGWLNNESAGQIHMRAAEAYSRYQSCSVKAASRLLASGY